MTDALPDTMKAVEIPAPGGPDVLRTGARPVPRPAGGEILVKVAAAGVNYPDVMQRKGQYPPPPGTTDIPGLELAGTVVESASDAFSPGDEVCALVSGGAYAEYCAVPAPQALPLPKGFDMLRAAALPETFFTVWTNLFDGGRLEAGETALVHGGSGGIGSVAVQMAKAFGATVLATARTDEKCRACEDLGADRAINYMREDFVEIAKAANDGAGCNLVLDMVGGDYFARNLAALAPGGRLVQIAVRNGAKVELFLPRIMTGRLTVTGSVLRPRTVAEKGAIAERLLERVWPLLESGIIRPVIHRIYPLADAAAAHHMMERGEHVGKLMLDVAGAVAATEQPSGKDAIP